MLPFTKRPGRGGEDGVFTKDDLDDLAVTNEKPATAPPPSKRPIAKPDDFGDDEVTNFIPSKSVSAIVHDARSQPGTIPPPPASRRPPASVPPPPMSQRPGKFITNVGHVGGADEDEDGRTVVRGAPKIIRKSLPPPSHHPASMSPAAVIKATLESSRAAKRAHEGALMPPPPAELLEDMTDRLAADDPRLALASRIAAAPPNSVPPPPQSQRPHMMQGGSMHSPYTAPMGMTPMGVSELGATMLAGMNPHSQPPSSRGPMTGPPPPMHLAHGHGHGYAPPPPSASGSIPPPPQSYRPPSSYAPAPPSGNHSGVPAHFMVPNGPYSDGRMDPPGTSVTARHKVSGRPASAWAIALVAAGLFVGIGAVAVMQSNDSLMDTTASFVDPSRAAPAKAAAPAAPAAEPVPQAAPTTAVAPAVNVPLVPPAANGDPHSGGLIGASAPAAHPPVAAAPAAPTAEPKPEAKPAAVAANPAPIAPKTTWIAPRAQAPVAAAPAPAPAPKPAAPARVATNDDPPAEKPTKPTKPTRPGKGDATDDETKKALEALQKAQLESSFDK